VKIVLLPLALASVLVLIGVASRDEPAAAPPPQVRLVEVGRFREPLDVTAPPDDERLFIVEKKGRIWIVDGGRRLRLPFLDISRSVSTEGLEEGLLSLAFAPDYRTSGRFYVDYTDREHRTVVEEYRRSRKPDVADPRTRRRLLRIFNPTDRHHAGHLLFGPDGYLYIAQGDGGTSSVTNHPAQRLDNLHGKILRIDPRPRGGRAYTIPRDNPFVGRPGRDEIWLYGLRNPWRMAVDPATGTLVIGDAGQLSVEEVDIAPRSGLNFGWNCFEGRARFFPGGIPACANAVPPVVEHLRGSSPLVPRTDVKPVALRGRPRVDTRLRAGGRSCSVVAGVFVRDPDLPALSGRHVYGDFCDPRLRSFRIVGNHADDESELGVQVPVTSSFGTDSAGHVYVTSLAGPVYRLAPP
jgi:hypothetical protein